MAVWGCGPVGQFAMQSAWMLGAERVIAIDRVPERLRMAEQHSKAETINFDDVKVYDRLMELTSGRGPDRCIDAVGAEAHGSGSFDAIVDKAKAAVMLGTDRPHVLREAIMCCRKAGTIPVPGVYIGLLDKIPFGAAIRAAPAVPWLSAFPELNVRTYVRAADRPGVYFFSLDAGRRLAVAAARASLICPTMPPP